MTRSILVGVLLLAAFQRTASLGGELLTRNLPMPRDGADLDQPITSYSTLDDERGFAIAYYGVEPDGTLHELRVRTYDNATRTWRKWTRAEPIGSVVGLQRGGRFLFVTGHSSPSASSLLVLTASLEQRRELDGWPKLVLPDSRVFFLRSMRHFAPTQAQALALYDASADREIAVYPDSTVRNDRGAEPIAGTDLWMDRSIEAVKMAAENTIEFAVVEQRMRLDRQQRAAAAGPEQRFVVACAVATPQPECRKRP